MLKKLSFNNKLILTTCLIVIAALIVMLVVGFWMSKRSHIQSGQMSLQDAAMQMEHTLRLQHDILIEKMDMDIDVLQENLMAWGTPNLDEAEEVEMNITHQQTGDSQTVTMPVLKAGFSTLTKNQEFVDDMQEIAGVTSTLFQKVEDKLVGVSTNVRDEDGQRTVGTYIPADSEVYQAISAGEDYRGRAFVVDDWYLTAYSPLLNRSEEVIGAAYVGRELIDDNLQRYLDQVDIEGGGYTYAFDAEGEILVHPDEDMLGRNIRELPFGEKLQQTDRGLINYEHQGQTRYAQIITFEPWEMSFAVSVDEATLIEGVNIQALQAAGLSSGVGLALVLAIILPVSRRLTAPIRQMAVQANEVAKGNYDYSFDYQIKDDIGRTIGAMQHMVGSIKQQIGLLNGILHGLVVPYIMVDDQGKITRTNQAFVHLLGQEGDPEELQGQDASDILQDNINQDLWIKKAIQENKSFREQEMQLQNNQGRTLHLQVSAFPLLDLDEQLIGGFSLFIDQTQIKDQAERLERHNHRVQQVSTSVNSIADQVSTAAEELSSQIEQASQGAENQKQRVSETATSMEEMNANVLEVAKNASSAAQYADQARETAEQGSSTVQSMLQSISQVQEKSQNLRENMNQLGTQAQSIGQVMDVISDIADQTNLLALNAAIEAARAGDAGKGFAVVADEVRKLAEKTMQATKEVGQAVNDIQAGIRAGLEHTESTVQLVNDSTTQAEDSGQALQSITQAVQETADQVRSIATAAEEQSSASEEINTAVEEINRISSETADVMQQSAQAVLEMSKQAGELRNLTQTLQEASDKMESMAEELKDIDL